MGPTFTRKNGKTYRYYLCSHASKNGYAKCPIRTVHSGENEEAVVGQLRGVFRSPEIVARTFREARARETQEIERLRREETDLREKLEVQKAAAAQLLESKGNGGTAIAEDLRRTGDEIDDTKRRLAVAARQFFDGRRDTGRARQLPPAGPISSEQVRSGVSGRGDATRFELSGLWIPDLTPLVVPLFKLVFPAPEAAGAERRRLHRPPSAR